MSKVFVPYCRRDARLGPRFWFLIQPIKLSYLSESNYFFRFNALLHLLPISTGLSIILQSSFGYIASSIVLAMYSQLIQIRHVSIFKKPTWINLLILDIDQVLGKSSIWIEKYNGSPRAHMFKSSYIFSLFSIIH